MKIYDELIKIDISNLFGERNSRVYAKCHEENKKVEKYLDGIGHYFVFENDIRMLYLLKRTLAKPEVKNGIVVICYDIDKYSDFIAFQCIKRDKNTFTNKKEDIFLLSNDYKKCSMDRCSKAFKQIKIESTKGFRPGKIYKTIFHDVDISKYEKDFLIGIGNRKSYGCGLIIPEKVYNHLLNFI